MKKEKTKSKLKIVLPIIIISALIIICAISINTKNISKDTVKEDSNEEKNSELDRLMEEAEVLDWKNVYKDITEDISKTNEYNERIFVYTGKVQNIDKEYNKIELNDYLEYLENGNEDIDNNKQINVFLNNKEDFNKFNENENAVISVVGKLKITGNIYDLENAYVIPFGYKNSKYLCAVLKNKDGKYCCNYKMDQNTGLPLEYTEVYYTMIGNSPERYRNEEKHILKYDENNNVIEEQINNILINKTTGKKGNVTNKYTYNEDNKLVSHEYVGYQNNSYIETYTYRKNEKNQIIEKIKTRDNDTIISTYEYNDKNQVIKEMVRSNSSQGTIVYEYYDNGEYSKKGEHESITYYYDQNDNLIKSCVGSSITHFICYGIVDNIRI